MANYQVKEVKSGVNEETFSQQTRLRTEDTDVKLACAEVRGGTEAAMTGESAEVAQDEWAVGTACYMCHACTNFGVHGKEGRPCAKGLSDLINRRHKVRKSAHAARRKSV